MHGRVRSCKNPCEIRKSRSRWYHILLACFKPYNALHMRRPKNFSGEGVRNFGKKSGGGEIYNNMSRLPYRYVVTTSMRKISSLKWMANASRYLNNVISKTGA